ncbi:hypothetical protein C0Q70_09349 [Pomacea canaliculata]|uniref:Cyclosome subunit 8 n=1 Tax=Pomacea canaliculata TaxID=400727 RepID=A0A2T7P9J3_POMCA|nr:cell division cycle protein 23 homolog [Pomacea canaliculata]PVD30088.1 hypothetical protein C0Q70_09349 [Pomacea canaliculata]
MADISSLDLTRVKEDLINAHRECSKRRLLHGAKWAAELSSALNVTVSPHALAVKAVNEDQYQDFDKVTLSTAYFDLKEYDRAANVVEGATSPLASFLHMYSRYLADITRQLDNASDSIGHSGPVDNGCLKTLRMELSAKHVNKQLDGFGLYLYGVVLKKLDLSKSAVDVLVEAVNREPLHWGAWQELGLLITDREMLLSLSLPNLWVRSLFLAQVYLELQLHEEALEIYQAFMDAGFSRSNFIIAQIAIAHHNMRDVDQAVAAFSELEKIDPYRLENMDIYSNLLYVKEMRADLAHLAHRCCNINKYRVETCCVIGNYYSLRTQHEKAIMYFQRALRLNPHYLSAWTLMGHEFMEMKNTSAAIQAYRQAIEVNKRDYRAWYGLGQTYEILKMPFYSLYYYRQAHLLKPNDSRMLMALGECYEKLDRLQESKKCFRKAHSIGDVEGGALFKLAKLYERLSEEEQAASAFTEYIVETERKGTHSHEEMSQAYRYLANYYLARRQLDDAYATAQKCAEFTETREDAKVLLQQIQALRSHSEGLTPIHLDDSIESLPTDCYRPSDSHSFGRVTPVNLTFTP